VQQLSLLAPQFVTPALPVWQNGSGEPLEDDVLLAEVLDAEDVPLLFDEEALDEDEVMLPPVPQSQALHADPFATQDCPPLQAAGPTQVWVAPGLQTAAEPPLPEVLVLPSVEPPLLEQATLVPMRTP
jgi:hypothetical protein